MINNDSASLDTTECKMIRHCRMLQYYLTPEKDAVKRDSDSEILG